MYNDENIKKLVEDAIKNMDPNGEFFKNVVSQITDQIKKEQEKIFAPKVTNIIKNKADNYLKNNKSLNDYISNRDKFMELFEKITQDKIEEDVNDTKNVSYTSYTSGWKQTTNEDGKPIGYLYFNFNSNNEQLDIYKQILDYYSILTLYADEWDNWKHEHNDYDLTNDDYPLSMLVDEYHCEFKEDRSGSDMDENDLATSFIFTKLDDELKMLSVYMIVFSRKTNILYNYKRMIITLPETATETDYKNYYINLKDFFSIYSRIITIPDFVGGTDDTYSYYDFVNLIKVNNHPAVTDEDTAHKLLQGDLLHQIIDKINSESTKIEIKKEDTPDKTNSILDKLGIPHDNNGNVEIPITDGVGLTPDKFISNRMDSMNKASEFLKSWFDFDDDTDKDINSQQPIYQINTEHEHHAALFSNAINDGYIKIAGISRDNIHIEINGTYVIMKNPYVNMPDRDFYGNKIDKN